MVSKMKKNLYFYLIILIFLTCVLVLLNHSKISPHLNEFSRLFTKFKFHYVVAKNSDKCKIKTIKSIPANSILVLGHFYGHPTVSTNKQLGDLPKFLLDNKSKIKLMIFTGDIFKTPSLNKWKNLSSVFKQNEIPFLIAPGNHDYSLEKLDQQQEFKTYFNFEYPISWKDKNSFFIIEDTNSSRWSLSKESHQLIKDHQDLKVSLYIFSHHILIGEMEMFANSHTGKPKILPLASELLLGKEKFYKKTTIINGDTGATDYMYPKVCKSLDDLKIIANGFGPRQDNEILVIHENEIFSYVL